MEENIKEVVDCVKDSASTVIEKITDAANKLPFNKFKTFAITSIAIVSITAINSINE